MRSVSSVLCLVIRRVQVGRRPTMPEPQNTDVGEHLMQKAVSLCWWNRDGFICCPICMWCLYISPYLLLCMSDCINIYPDIFTCSCLLTMIIDVKVWLGIQECLRTDIYLVQRVVNLSGGWHSHVSLYIVATNLNLVIWEEVHDPSLYPYTAVVVVTRLTSFSRAACCCSINYTPTTWN